ncbi:MAG: hypothetical protein AB1679_10775 [Actinomycetota bacterium]|jgi:hypothetical protein
MSRRDEAPTERSGYRVVRSWREKGAWYARQEDFPDAKEAWAAFHAADTHIASRGDDAQVDLYDLARGEVVETARAGGPHLIDAGKVVLSAAELRRRIDSLFAPSEPRRSEGETA